MFTCKKKKKTIIGYLDDTTRVVAAERFFVIQYFSNEKNKWIGGHYYSHFSDVFSAYARLLLNREDPAVQGQSKSIVQILDRVLMLERKIEEASNRLQNDWKRFISDPIEREMLKREICQ